MHCSLGRVRTALKPAVHINKLFPGEHRFSLVYFLFLPRAFFNSFFETKLNILFKVTRSHAWCHGDARSRALSLSLSLSLALSGMPGTGCQKMYAPARLFTKRLANYQQQLCAHETQPFNTSLLISAGMVQVDQGFDVCCCLLARCCGWRLRCSPTCLTANRSVFEAQRQRWRRRRRQPEQLVYD